MCIEKVGCLEEGTLPVPSAKRNSAGYTDKSSVFVRRKSVHSILRAVARLLFELLHAAPQGWVYDILDRIRLLSSVYVI
jgi:hypothetical protein